MALELAIGHEAVEGVCILAIVLLEQDAEVGQACVIAHEGEIQVVCVALRPPPFLA